VATVNLIIPYDIDFDSAGNVYVVESNNNRIQKFDSNGAYVSQFGTSGDDDGEFDEPRGLVIDNSDNMWVTDYSNYRVQKFDSNGAYVSQFGASGTGDGQFSEMYGIDVDSSGNIYVVDRGNCRIQKFNSSGVFVTKWGAGGGAGTCGENNGEFDSPYDVKVDSSGNVYVVDEDNDRVQKFDSNGTYISQFGGFGSLEISSSSDNGKFSAPRDMAQDSHGNIYVADGANNRIQKFNSNGVFIEAWGANGGDGTNGTGNGEFDFPEAIVIDSSDNVYVGEANNYRVQKLDSDGNFIAKWGANGGNGSSGSGDGEFASIRGLAIASDGNLLVVDNGNYRVQKINSTTGAFISKFGSAGTGDGQFDTPAGITVDVDGNIYVADMYNYRIQKFTSTGTFVTKWGQYGTSDGEFAGVSAVDVDSLGNVYVLDYDNNRIQKFDTDGNYLAQWGGPGTGDGQFDSPEGLQVSANGNTVMVADSDNQRIQIFKYGQDEVSADLNGDSIADNTQSNVGGYTNPITGKITAIDVGNACELTTDDYVLEDQLAVQDSAYNYESGLWDFEADCGTPGYTTTIKLYYYDISPDGKVLRKHNPSINAYFTINDANISTQNINGHTVTVVTYQITDGGERDIDGLINGLIKDPAGLAQSVVGAPNTGL
jgi:tripartite motif-containing protein 71